MTTRDADFPDLDELASQWYRATTQAEVRHYAEQPAGRQPWYDGQRAGEATAAWADRLRRRRLWLQWLGPEQRRFFHACRRAVAERQRGTLQKWLDPHRSPLTSMLQYFHDDVRCPQLGSTLWPRLEAHLRCAQAALPQDFWPATGYVSEQSLAQIRQQTQLPPGLLRDLAGELTGQEPRAVKARQTMPVPLVDPKTGEGSMVRLTMELLADGTGEIYPAPSCLFLLLDEQFVQGEQTARQFVAETLGWADRSSDLRWSLEGYGSLLPAAIGGNSASAALGLLCARLCAG